MKNRVLIVDDHQIVSDGVKTLLEDSHYVVIGTASSEKECLTIIKENTPEVILMDVKLGSDSGIYTTKMIKADYPETKVVMLSSSTDEYAIIESIKAGADGFLTKSCGKEELLKALEEVLKGFQYFSKAIQPTMLKSLLNRIKYPNLSEQQHLTDREIEITRLFAEGMRYKEIGEELNISTSTVESHKNKILTKLGLKTTLDLVKFAIKNKIIEL